MLKTTLHLCQGEDDYWRIRNFLREVFLLNNRSEHSWHVARLDYWRWHFVINLQICESIEKCICFWETQAGEIAAALNSFGSGEIRLHIHPDFRSVQLESEIFATAEDEFHFTENERRYIYLPVDTGDVVRQKVLTKRGYTKRSGTSHKWWRDLQSPISEPVVPPGYLVRSMGDISEHPARSWASWRAFHSDEPEENYDGDWSWYQNIQAAPLYRRDLDIVSISPQGDIASFATIYYDDHTLSAVCVLVGTAAEHQRRGLGKAVLEEGFRRLQRMGCTRVFATAYDPPADALYGSVMESYDLAETWLKEIV